MAPPSGQASTVSIHPRSRRCSQLLLSKQAHLILALQYHDHLMPTKEKPASDPSFTHFLKTSPAPSITHNSAIFSLLRPSCMLSCTALHFSQRRTRGRHWKNPKSRDTRGGGACARKSARTFTACEGQAAGCTRDWTRQLI